MTREVTHAIGMGVYDPTTWLTWKTSHYVGAIIPTPNRSKKNEDNMIRHPRMSEVQKKRIQTTQEMGRATAWPTVPPRHLN